MFAGLSAVWGASFLFIKVGLEGLSPAQVVSGRLLLGTLTLGAMVVVRRLPLPREPRVWGTLLVVGALLCVIPFSLFAFAETRIPSGLASIWNATTPLTTMLLALAFLPGERPTPTRLAGLATGAFGVLVVLGVWRLGSQTRGHDDVLGQVACLGATTCYAVAFVVLRRLMARTRLDAVVVAFLQVGLGAAVMLLLAPVVSTAPMHLTWAVVVSVTLLGCLGTGVAYAWNTRIVQGLGATTASTVTYLTPVVGVLPGVAVLGERPRWNHAVGAVLVVAGIAVGQGRIGRGRRAQRSSPA